MPIKHHFTLLSDYFLRSDAGRISIIGTINNIELSELPGIVSRLFITIGFAGEPSEELKVTIRDTNKKDVMVSVVSTGSIAERHPLKKFQQSMHVSVIELSPIGFNGPGVFEVILWEGKKVIHRFPFGVLLNETSREVDNGTSGS